MKHSFPLFAGSLLLSTGVLYLGYGVDRMDFTSLFGSFLVSFAGYLVLVYRPQPSSLKLLISLGITLRLALVFAFPLLSDDIYRFIWDGHLVASGINPFAQLPAFYLEPGNEVAGLSPELFERLNSPEYYTIYPPVAQGVFTVAAWLSPNSWYGASVVMKLFLLFCELGSLWLLWQLFQARPQVPAKVVKDQSTNGPVLPKDQKTTRLLLYWLNPLIIVEIMGNLHFEGAMVFFLLLAYYWLQRSNWVASAAAMAASVASKLLPLMLLPFLIRRLWGRPFWIFSAAFGICCLLFFAPFLLAEDFIDGFRASLELYQRKFEFNASLYYLARAYGYYEIGWNQIARFGPLLAKVSAGGILLMALVDRRRDWASLAEGWLWAFVLYLLCATTVHPWYLSVPIVLCCFTRWRFPLVWSFLIMLTYTNYLTVPYEENLWLVAAEYVLVAGFAFWEWRRRPLPSLLLGP
ncbi:MAG: glycosyltransferase 87 family protein [Bacteroidota bacterium]